MSFNWREMCGSKIVNMESAIRLINCGDHIFMGSTSGSPTDLMYGLVEYKEFLGGHEVAHILTLGDAPHIAPDLVEKFRHNALFIGSNARKAVQQGYADYTPIFLSEVPRMIKSGRIPVDVALLCVSPPDENGYCSLGVDIACNQAAIQVAHTIICEVNENMPYTYGDTLIHIDKIDAMIESDHQLPELSFESDDEVSDRIGRYIAELVEDGSTLQLGIGTIPDAVLKHLGDKKNLGIHTEMFSDGVIPLIEKGIINNKCKTLHPGKMIASFLIGSNKLYQYCHKNPNVEFYPCDYTNDPFVVSRNDKMIAINAAIEVDLTGQVCSDSMGTRFYSGIGGQVDFIRGAARSRGGKPIIAMPSVAMGGLASKIVPTLSEGAGVVTTRGDVHYIVTEYGVAVLHGKTVRERALALINIAHPKFRPWLYAEAKKRGFIARDYAEIETQIPIYPDRYKTSRVLPNGKKILIRPIMPTDEERLNDMFYNMSEESILNRLLYVPKTLPRKQLQGYCTIDYQNEMALVACLKKQDAEEEEIIAVARYILDPSSGLGEITLGVRDSRQGKGVGRMLLNQILQVARRQNVKGFHATIREEDTAMLHILETSGYPIEKSLEDGIYDISLMLQTRPPTESEVKPGSIVQR